MIKKLFSWINLSIYISHIWYACFYAAISFYKLAPDFLAFFLQVLAIGEGLHDVYTLGKEAATLHSSLMTNMSKVCHELYLLNFLPPRSI
jgi:hypothetical protein